MIHLRLKEGEQVDSRELSILGDTSLLACLSQNQLYFGQHKKKKKAKRHMWLSFSFQVKTLCPIPWIVTSRKLKWRNVISA